MSVWTHVVGCIRVDGVPSIHPDQDMHTVKKILGPVSTWKHPADTHLPEGSEGSLQYEIIEYDEGLPWLAIPVWGDLRDFDDAERIRRWFDLTIDEINKTFMVRDACLRIEVEGMEPVVLGKSG